MNVDDELLMPVWSGHQEIYEIRKLRVAFSWARLAGNWKQYVRALDSELSFQFPVDIV